MQTRRRVAFTPPRCSHHCRCRRRRAEGKKNEPNKAACGMHATRHFRGEKDEQKRGSMWDARHLVIEERGKANQTRRHMGCTLPRTSEGKNKQKRDDMWDACHLVLSRRGKRVETRRRVDCTPPHHRYELPPMLVISQHSSWSSAHLPNHPDVPATFGGGVARVAIEIGAGEGGDVAGWQVVLGGNAGRWWVSLETSDVASLGASLAVGGGW